jgi:thiamine-monophosphate kinase
MQFQNWGEDQFIEHLTKQFPSKDSIVGIGDDSAVIPEENGKAWLISTDALVEGIHFLKDQVAAKDLGYKTVAVNVSDIAAMGGEPKYAFLSLALPKTTDCFWTQLVIDGVKEACEKWNILLLGGDTVGSQSDIFLSLTLIGSAIQDKIKYRDSAQPGDLICVSGYLGDSGGGLKALQEETTKTTEIQHLIHAHFRPEPSPNQGTWLAAHNEVHAMMDISDGLDCDLRRLIKKSRTGAEIETNLIPLSASLSNVSVKEDWDALQLALVGGEDYCLLLTVAPESFENLQHTFETKFSSSLFPIGSITDRIDELIYYKNGQKIQIDYANYNHFK